MTKRLLTLLLTATLFTTIATAHDFEVDGIYYYKTGTNPATVAVSYRGQYYDTYTNEYTGSIVIPSSVTYSGVTYSVTSIGYNAFRGCSGLTSVTIPSSVTSIGGYAFSGCSGLTNVTIPNSVTSIGSSAFYGTPWYNNNPDGLVYAGLVAYKYKGTMPAGTSINIKDGTTGIAESCFSGCSSLASVTIPNSVTSIGGSAFQGCTGLTSVTIPSSVTSIGGSAFQGCTGLTSVTIPNSVTSIDYQTFYGCSGLTSITIPNSVTSIGSSAFWGCSGLTSIKVANGNTKYDSRNNCNAIIETSTNSLIAGCKSTIIPNSVTSIGSSAFRGCSGLTSVTIPNSVTSIGSSAFYGCSSMKYVVCESSTPPYGSSSMFPTGIIVMVPMGSLNDYQKKSYWKEYQLQYSLCKIEPYYTQAKIYSLNKAISKLNSVQYYGGPSVATLTPTAGNDTIFVNGLTPNTQYSVHVKSHTGNSDIEETLDFKTKELTVTTAGSASTQTSITVSYNVGRDNGMILESATLSCNGIIHNGSVEKKTDNYLVTFGTITGLAPNTQYPILLTLKINGQYIDKNFNIKTKDISANSDKKIGPTSVNILPSYEAGDANVSEAYFEWNNAHVNRLLVTGLDPETNYSLNYYIVTTTGTVTKDMSFKTPSLTMTTQPARMLTNSNPMFIAETNIADVETSCGFEWRRYDAPPEMPSTQVYCPVYDGMMAGVVKNMTENVYYKYRPFYKSSNGSMYYGDWVAFITADANVEFEPVVYTYNAPEVTQTGAVLQGVALPGSSDITDQGFEYWRSTGSNHAPALNAPSSGITKVKANGQRMSATIEGLSAGTTYGFRSYVVAGGQTYYGSEVTFTTEKPDGLRGDVDGNGMVDVDDVNAMINLILLYDQYKDKYPGSADLDGNGMVDVDDVNALINIILNK